MTGTALQDGLQLSHWIEAVESSPTMTLSARAMAMRRDGRDVLNLAAGEPDFDTPEHIREAAKRAIDEGKTRYTPAAGVPELREAVAKRVANRAGYEIKPEQVVITAGAKFALYVSLAARVNPGDEVLVPAPYWVSYPSMVGMTGGRQTTVWAGPDQDYKVTVADLEAACTDRTRGLIFNSPSNPTGAVYSPEETCELAGWAAGRGLWIISDEIYAEQRFGTDPYCSMLTADPRGLDGTILCDGFSKAYAMTGWRLGYLVGTADLARACTRMLGQTTSNASSVSQYAALAAATGPQEAVVQMTASFRERRDRIYSELEKIPGIACPMPEGAFYFFIDVRSYLGRKTPAGTTVGTSSDLCEFLLEHEEIALVPGEGFGAPGFLRLSYAAAEDVLTEAVMRFARGLKQLLA